MNLLQIPSTDADDSEFARLLSNNCSPIGVGATREVYAIPGHANKVLKIAREGSNRANWTEAVIYTHLIEEAKPFFGEVLSVSRSGKYLVMECLDDVPVDETRGLEVPAWWTDRKPSGLGRSVNGVIKIRDYALVNFPRGALVPLPASEEVSEMARLLAITRKAE